MLVSTASRASWKDDDRDQDPQGHGPVSTRTAEEHLESLGPEGIGIDQHDLLSADLA